MSRQDAADGGAQGNLGGGFNLGNGFFTPSISADGRFVAFDSPATNLIPGGGPDVNGSSFDVFVRRLEPPKPKAKPKAMPWLSLLLGDE